VPVTYLKSCTNKTDVDPAEEAPDLATGFSTLRSIYKKNPKPNLQGISLRNLENDKKKHDCKKQIRKFNNSGSPPKKTHLTGWWSGTGRLVWTVSGVYSKKSKNKTPFGPPVVVLE